MGNDLEMGYAILCLMVVDVGRWLHKALLLEVCR